MNLGTAQLANKIQHNHNASLFCGRSLYQWCDVTHPIQIGINLLLSTFKNVVHTQFQK